MNAIDILENIQQLKAKKELLEVQGKKDTELQFKVKAYNILKEVLTEREEEVLKLYYEKGYTQRRIAAELMIGSSTTTRDLSKIRSKFSEIMNV
jgi:DNA-directed RNA polymerase specialized sigma subunit